MTPPTRLRIRTLCIPLALAGTLVLACADKQGGDSGGSGDGGASDGGSGDGGSGDGGSGDGGSDGGAGDGGSDGGSGDGGSDGGSGDGGSDGGSGDGGSDGGSGDGGSGDGGVPAEGPDCSPSDWPYDTPFNLMAWHAFHGTADDVVLDDLADFAADVVGTPGPWSHKVVGPWTSSDGVTWTEAPTLAEIDLASVPAATIGPDGDVWIFFVDGDVDALVDSATAGIALEGLGVAGLGGLRAARSSDGVRFELVDVEATGDGPLFVVDPTIAELPDGTYRMFFYGIQADEMCADTPDPFQVPPPHRTYAASSTDLVHWEHEGPVFTVDYSGTDPAIWCTEDHDTCWLLMGLGGVSTDGGLSFSEVAMSLPTPPPQVPTAFRTDDGWRMLYRDPGPAQTHAASSSDGVTWTDEGISDPDIDAPTVAGFVGDWVVYGVEQR